MRARTPILDDDDDRSSNRAIPSIDTGSLDLYFEDCRILTVCSTVHVHCTVVFVPSCVVS